MGELAGPGSTDEDRRQAAHYLSAAYRDDMTGALNRRPGREQMQALFDRTRRDATRPR